MERRTWIGRVAAGLASLFVAGEAWGRKPSAPSNFKLPKPVKVPLPVRRGLKPLTVHEVDELLDIPWIDPVQKMTIKNRLLELGHMDFGAIKAHWNGHE